MNFHSAGKWLFSFATIQTLVELSFVGVLSLFSLNDQLG